MDILRSEGPIVAFAPWVARQADLRENSMADDKDFQVKVQRIGELVGELENIADPEARASAKALVQLLLDLHGAGLERVMEIVAKNGESGQRTIDDLGRDPLVSSLLVLYGLHPLDVESRVAQAVEQVRPQVRKGGGELDLLGIESWGRSVAASGYRARLWFHRQDAEEAMVEDALYEAVPGHEPLDY